MIEVHEFCTSHNIEVSFLQALQNTGLIEITTVRDTIFINTDQLLQVEKYIRFYYELDINLEGIECITHLLDRLTSMQAEIILLRNRLGRYELNT